MSIIQAQCRSQLALPLVNGRLDVSPVIFGISSVWFVSMPQTNVNTHSMNVQRPEERINQIVNWTCRQPSAKTTLDPSFTVGNDISFISGERSLTRLVIQFRYAGNWKVNQYSTSRTPMSDNGTSRYPIQFLTLRDLTCGCPSSSISRHKNLTYWRRGCHSYKKSSANLTQSNAPRNLGKHL